MAGEWNISLCCCVHLVNETRIRWLYSNDQSNQTRSTILVKNHGTRCLLEKETLLSSRKGRWKHNTILRCTIYFWPRLWIQVSGLTKVILVDAPFLEDSSHRAHRQFDNNIGIFKSWREKSAAGTGMLKPWPNGCNMLVQHLATLLYATYFTCVWPPCCTMLRSFGHPARHVATWSNNGACNMVHPFGHGLTHAAPVDSIAICSAEGLRSAFWSEGLRFWGYEGMLAREIVGMSPSLSGNKCHVFLSVSCLNWVLMASLNDYFTNSDLSRI